MYDPYNFYEQAETLSGTFEKYGTPVHMIPVYTEKGFINTWNRMGIETVYDDKSRLYLPKMVGIDGVGLVFHGSALTINIDTHNDEYLTTLKNGKTPQGALATYIGNLNPKEFESLVILSCNAGHLDRMNDNVAAPFLNNNNIKNGVIACDGNVAFSREFGFRSFGFGDYIPRLSGKQTGFYKYAKGNRKPSGFHIYTRKFNFKTDKYETVIKFFPGW